MAARQASFIDRLGERTNLAGMMSRLTRILMALVTAFVFTGQMEAAAQHCAQLAKAAASDVVVATTETEGPPCHEATAAAHAAMSHDHDASNHGAADHSGHDANHSNAPPHCACIAALTGWIDVTGAATSTRVETYAWLAPSEMNFASSKPDPDLRPPRA